MGLAVDGGGWIDGVCFLLSSVPFNVWVCGSLKVQKFTSQRCWGFFRVVSPLTFEVASSSASFAWKFSRLIVN